MEDTTSTLHIRRTGQYHYEVTILETGATKTAATLDSALNTTLHQIVKHLTTRYLILVFADQSIDQSCLSSPCVLTMTAAGGEQIFTEKIKSVKDQRPQ